MYFLGVTCTVHEFVICQDWFLIFALLLSSCLTSGKSISLTLNFSLSICEIGQYLTAKVLWVSVELIDNDGVL